MKKRRKAAPAPRFLAAADALYAAVAAKLLNNIDRLGIYREHGDGAMEDIADAARAYRALRDRGRPAP